MLLFKNPIIKLSVLTVAIVVISMSVVFILKNKIEDKTAQLQEKRNMLEVLEKRDENFLELKSTNKLVEKNLLIIEKMLPDEKNIEKFVTMLENIAAKTNTDQVLFFDPIESAKPVGEKINSLEFSITLMGNFYSLINYLEEFEKLPYFIKIKNVTIENSLGIANNNSQLNLKSEIYIKCP